MLIILKKELNMFFTSLMAYVIIGFFLMMMGLLVWVFPQTNVLDGGYATLQPLFDWSPYVFMFLVPAVTMRAFAEEKKNGTLEVLFTSPLTITQIILGKYAASLIIIVITLLFTNVYYFTLRHLGNQPGNIDTAAVIGSYLGLVMLTAVFSAIGLLASSLTENQTVAFLLGVFFCFLLYQGFDAWQTLQAWKNYALYIGQLGVLYHYDALRKGVVDSRDLVYFGSMVVTLLFFTKVVLKYQK